MKKIEDYLHLYIGCDCLVQFPEDRDGILCQLDSVSKECATFTKYAPDYYFNEPECGVKPILRRLSSMTEEERAELWGLVFGNILRKFTGHTQWFERASLSSDPRWVLLQGVERLGIEMNGTVWADSDLQTWKHNQHEVTRWLLSKSFDLFQLIDEGLAIDKETVK